MNITRRSFIARLSAAIGALSAPFVLKGRAEDTKEIYGRSPLLDTLPEHKKLNAILEAHNRARRQFNADMLKNYPKP